MLIWFFLAINVEAILQFGNTFYIHCLLGSRVQLVFPPAPPRQSWNHLLFWKTLVEITVVFLCVCVLSHVPLFATPWTIAHQPPLSMEFFRQEYWSGLPFSTPLDLPDPGMELTCLASPVLAGRFFTTTLPGKPCFLVS